MKTPTASSATSSQREQTSLRSQVPRSPRSNVCSTRDLENPSASVHRKRFSTPSLTPKISMRWEVESATLNPESPLYGVPFLAKDLFAEIAGTPLHEGSAFLRGCYESPRDSELVTRWREAGLVL